MKKILLTVLCVYACAASASAQVTVPNTFVTGARILASEVNANFSALSNGSLNRTGGTITGNIAVDSGITIDSIDIGAVLGGTGTPTFSTITVSSTSTLAAVNISGNVAVNTNKFTVASATGNTLVAGTFDVTGNTDLGGSLTVGSGNVALVTSAGKITAISSTYFDNLSGTNLTGIGLLASTNTWTGRNDLKGYTELKSTANPSGGAITYDLSAGTHFETSLTGNATVTISNVPAPSNGVVAFTVKFVNDGTARTFTWPGSVKWPGGTAVDFTDTNNRVDFVTFVSYDGGTTWYGFVGGLNFQ